MKNTKKDILLKEILEIKGMMGIVISEQSTPSPTAVPIVKTQKTPSDRLGPQGDFQANRNFDPANKKSTGPITYFNFANMAKIPYVQSKTTLYYLKEPIDLSQLLGVKNKDIYGYYDEVFIESYGQKIKRYYPTSDWDDWMFLIRNKIPYAFLNRDDNLGDRFFHLILKLIDPVKSVTDLEDPNNKSRGWILSGPGMKTSDPTDSGTGYYYTEGNTQIPYNITEPMIPGDMSTYDLDDRSGFDRFMDSYASMGVQIIVQIVVTLVTKNLAVGTIVAEGAVSILSIQTRLLVVTMLAEAAVNIPTAVYYFNRPGYETIGYISLLFCFIPYAQYKIGLGSIIQDFSVKTATEIAEKVVAQPIGKMTTKAELKAFMQKLTMEQKALFINVLKNIEKINPLLKSAAESLAKQSERQLMKNADYVLARKQILEYMSTNSGFIKSFVADFGSTIGMMKIAESVLSTLEKNDKSLENETKKKQQDAKDNLKKVEEEINKFPEWVKMSINTNEFKSLPLDLTLEDVKFLAEKGMVSPGLYQKINDEAIRQAKKYALDHPNPETLRIEELQKMIRLWKQYKEDSTFKDQLSESDKKLLDEYINQYTKIVETRKQKETEELKRKEEEELDKELSKPIPTIPLSSLTIDYGWAEITKDEYFKKKQDKNYNVKVEKNSNGAKYYEKPLKQILPSKTQPTVQNKNTEKTRLLQKDRILNPLKGRKIKTDE